MTQQTSIARPPCHYCNAYHTGVCPRIESIEYHPNGAVAKIVLRPVA
jgi:hypothetical protein